MQKTNSSKISLKAKIIGGIAVVSAIAAIAVLMTILMSGNNNFTNRESSTDNNQTNVTDEDDSADATDDLARVIKGLPKYESLEYILRHINGYWVSTPDMFFGFIDGDHKQTVEYGLYATSYGVRGEVLSATATGEYSLKINIHIEKVPASEMDEGRPERDETIYLDISGLKQNDKIKIKIGDGPGSTWNTYSFGGTTLEESNGSR